MKTKEIKKGKPAVKKSKKTTDPSNGRIKPKTDTEVCALNEPVVHETLCCCEEVYC